MYTRLRTLLLILVQSTEIHVAIRGRCVLVFCRFYLLVCVQMHERCIFKTLWKLRNGKDVTCGQVWWPILGICALHLTHPSATTNTHTHTHTPRTHTRSSGHAFYTAAPGEQLGVRCLAQGHLSRGIEERALYIHSPHLQFLPNLRLEPMTFGLQVRLSIH